MDVGNQGQGTGDGESCLMCNKSGSGLVKEVTFQDKSKVRGAMDQLFQGLGIPLMNVSLVLFLLERPQTLCSSCHSTMHTLLALQGEVTALQTTMRKYAAEGIGEAILMSLGVSFDEEQLPGTTQSDSMQNLIMWNKFQSPVLQNICTGEIRLSGHDSESVDETDGESVVSSYSNVNVKLEELEEGEVTEVSKTAAEPGPSSSVAGRSSARRPRTPVTEERNLRRLRDTEDHERRNVRRTHESDMSKRRRERSPSSADVDRRRSYPRYEDFPCRYISIETPSSTGARPERGREWHCQRNCPFNITDNGEDLRRSVVNLRGNTVKQLGFVPEREDKGRVRGDRRRNGGRCVVRGCNAEGEWLDVPSLLHHIHGRMHLKGMRCSQSSYLGNK